MKIITLATGVLGALTFACISQKTVATSAGDVPTERAPDIGTIPGGGLLQGKLDQSLATASRVSQVLSITLTSPLVTKRKAVVVPTGAVAYGHVTELNAKPTSAPGASVQVAFDSLVFGGHEHVLDANVLKIDMTNVVTHSVDVAHPAAKATPAAETLITLPGSSTQIPAGTGVTLIVTVPVLLNPPK